MRRTLILCLAGTNIIENPNVEVRCVSSRVTCWRILKSVLSWATATFLEAEKGVRRSPGFRGLWVLAAALVRASCSKPVDGKAKAA